MSDYSCIAAHKGSGDGLISGGALRRRPLPRKIYVAGALSALGGLLLCGVIIHMARSGFAMQAAANFVRIGHEHLNDDLQLNGILIDTGTLELDAVVHDFRQTHPDFQIDSKAIPAYNAKQATKGLVKKKLGPDQKPEYKGGKTLTNKENFDQWYNDVPDVNMRVPIKLNLTRTPSGTVVLNNSAFFPINGRGFKDSIYSRNHFFTLELHTSFIYDGSETFTVQGDDDVWIFINGSLAIDLGGIHAPVEDTVNLDDLALTKGQAASLDIFFAERHTSGCHFAIETTIKLGQDWCAPLHYVELRSVAHNNLGGHGPDIGDKNLVFESDEYNPGREPRDMQLIVSVKPGSTYTPGSQGNHGLLGQYGRIGIKAGTEVTLNITFQDNATRSSTTQGGIDFTFLDLDQGAAGESSEYIEVGGFVKYALMSTTEVQVSPGAIVGTTRFSASKMGLPADDPIDDAILTLQQKNRAVMLSFENAVMVEVTMSCSAGTVDCNFLFKAKPSLKCPTDPITHEPLVHDPPTSTVTTTTTTTLEPTLFCVIDIVISFDKRFQLICFSHEPWWMFWKLDMQRKRHKHAA